MVYNANTPPPRSTSAHGTYDTWIPLLAILLMNTSISPRCVAACRARPMNCHCCRLDRFASDDMTRHSATCSGLARYVNTPSGVRIKLHESGDIVERCMQTAASALEMRLLKGCECRHTPGAQNCARHDPFVHVSPKPSCNASMRPTGLNFSDAVSSLSVGTNARSINSSFAVTIRWPCSAIATLLS